MRGGVKNIIEIEKNLELKRKNKKIKIKIYPQLIVKNRNYLHMTAYGRQIKSLRKSGFPDLR